REPHRASRTAPFAPGVRNGAIETLGLRLRLDETGARDDHREPHAAGDVAPARNARRLETVLRGRIRARSDEALVDADVGDRHVRLEPHVFERPRDAFPALTVALAIEIGRASCREE